MYKGYDIPTNDKQSLLPVTILILAVTILFIAPLNYTMLILIAICVISWVYSVYKSTPDDWY